MVLWKEGSGDSDQNTHFLLPRWFGRFAPIVFFVWTYAKVEGDAYTAFNSNDPRHAAAGRMSGGGMSEFEQRRSIG